MDDRRIAKLVRNLPTGLREAVSADARERYISFNDAAVAALASAYGVEFHPLGMRKGQSVDGPVAGVILRLPLDVFGCVSTYAERKGVSDQEEIVSVLCARYGVPHRPSGRKRYPRQRAAT